MVGRLIWDRKRKKKQKRSDPSVAFLLSDDANDTLCVPGYTTLDKCPEVVTACRRIAETISTMTIHLMENTENGDQRVVNELSRKIDISPTATMTRKTWMETIIMNLLLYGEGNSIVKVHTSGGYLEDLEPIPAHRVSIPSFGDYEVRIDGIPYGRGEIMHFVENPDPMCPWRGMGLRVPLSSVADNLKQSAATEKAFLASKWKPSVIVKVDALTEEFSSAAGRKKLLETYVASSEAGEPWLIPADSFEVTQVKPLSLSDLAINDSIQLNRQMVAAIMGVPAFLLGVGDYDQAAWNAFISTRIRPIVTGLQQEMTRALIVSPYMYLRFNILSLYDWDIQTLSSVFGGLYDRGLVSGNEVRDRMGMSPMDGLDDLRVLENYIPYDMSGAQKKLVQGGDEDGAEQDAVQDGAV